MPKLKFYDRFPSTAGMPNRFDGWQLEFPSGLLPLRIVFTVPGDRSGFTIEGKFRLDASEIELCFVLTGIERDSRHLPTAAHYHLSTPQNPIEPYRELSD